MFEEHYIVESARPAVCLGTQQRRLAGEGQKLDQQGLQESSQGIRNTCWASDILRLKHSTWPVLCVRYSEAPHDPQRKEP